MRLALCLMAVFTSSIALGSVGAVSAIEGTASRVSPAGRAPLVQGSAVELGDLIEVAEGSRLAVTLTDTSVLVLDEGTSLRIDEAEFQGLERRAFSAHLLLGRIWSKVKKALKGQPTKYEITSDRAIAGVRGTVFEVALSPDEARVQVEEGEVAVSRPGAPGAVESVRAGEALRVLREQLLRERVTPERPRFREFVRRNKDAWRRPLDQRAPHRRSLPREPLRR